MNDALRDRVIRMAWEDRTTFEELEKQFGLREAEVIKVMRQSLKPASFRRWRKRVSGRVTKHGKKFQANRQQLKSQDQGLLQRAGEE